MKRDFQGTESLVIEFVEKIKGFEPHVARSGKSTIFSSSLALTQSMVEAAAGKVPRISATDEHRAMGDLLDPKAVERPFLLIRSFRLLRTATPEEAEFVCSMPEVRAVAESRPVRRLAEDADLLRKIDRAADGGRLALLELAVEPQLKLALDDPELIALVRQVDLPAVAGAVARRRAANGRSAGMASSLEEDRPAAWRIGHALGSLLKEAVGR